MVIMQAAKPADNLSFCLDMLRLPFLITHNEIPAPALIHRDTGQIILPLNYLHFE